MKKIKKHIFFGIILFSVIYILLSFTTDFQLIIDALSNFNVAIIPIALLLILIVHFLRFIKWHYYLNVLKINLPINVSFWIYFSGLIMSLTPGKFGEVLKSFLLKDYNSTPISKSSPIIFIERLTEIYSLLILGFIGALLFKISVLPILLFALILGILTLLITNRKTSSYIIGLLSKIKYLTKYSQELKQLHIASAEMLKIRPVFYMTALTFLSWLIESFGFYLILINFDVQVSVIWSALIYSLSVLIGSISFLPAGLGITDGSLTYFVFKVTNSIDTSIAVTVIVRIITLWFVMLIGSVSLLYYNAKFRKRRIVE